MSNCKIAKSRILTEPQNWWFTIASHGNNRASYFLLLPKSDRIQGCNSSYMLPGTRDNFQLKQWVYLGQSTIKDNEIKKFKTQAIITHKRDNRK